MAGPMPKPDELRRLEGTERRKRTPTLIGGRVMPEDLDGITPVLEEWQRPAWEEIARPLAAAGLLDRADLPAVEAAARSLAILRAADHALASRGRARLSHHNSQGTVAHWAISIRNGASAEFRQWAAILGIGPASRTRLGRSAGSKPEGGMAGELARTLGPSARERLRVVGDAD